MEAIFWLLFRKKEYSKKTLQQIKTKNARNTKRINLTPLKNRRTNFLISKQNESTQVWWYIGR